MQDKEEHNTKKLIQNIDLEKPSFDFTDKVMTNLNAITDEALKDTELTVLLKKHSLETPKANFSSKVMAKVGVDSIIDYKPIISKKTWSILFFIFGGLTIYALISKPSLTFNNDYFVEYSTFFDKLIIDLNNFLIQSVQVPSILIVSIFCLTLLLLLDSILRTEKGFNPKIN